MKFPSDLLEALRAAQHIAVLTGAGASAESGVPTFRDAQTGLWAQFDPEELATPEAFRRNPKLVWEWYAWRRTLVERAQPNPGHFALVEMERHAPQFTLITQNVDGLHQLAGSRNVIELHGNIRRYKCFACETPHSGPLPEGEIPTCASCGGLLRPDVVWFGECLPAQAYRVALEAAQTCDVFFSVGTSGLVEPAASLPRIARRALATVVTINLDVKTEWSPNAYAIHGKSGEVLPALVSAAWG
ncbi:MAG: NAD-dependent deacylase [Anaerolineae bacterium]|nr:NAD-dependent deacylase [Candidatus Roseilinea sp.]MDW8451614.1 NAD-dependent deacylase [Anaerolineae bacterium]